MVQFNPGGNYAGQDLSHHNLSGLNLSGAIFDGANLSGAILDRADLRNARLREANLSKAKLRSANLNGADLFNANLAEASLARASLCRANLEKATLKNANLKSASLFAAVLVKANLESAWLKRTNFSFSNLEEAILSNADLTGAKLERARLIKARLSSSKLNRANLANANLQEAYLYKSNLEQAILIKANLTQANLEGANLSGANLDSAKLTKARLVYAVLDRAYLYRAHLDGAKLQGAQLNNTFLNYVILEGANLANARFFRVELKAANLRFLRLRGVNFEESDLSFSDLEGADLTKARLSQANLQGANLRRAKLNHANLERTNLICSDLSQAKLNDTSLCGADLTACKLMGAELKKANLKGTTLLGAVLENAILKNANLQRAYLSNAILRNCDLTNACLNQACLRGANLEGANLEEANLSGINTRMADFKGAFMPRNISSNFLEGESSIEDYLEDLENICSYYKKSVTKLEEIMRLDIPKIESYQEVQNYFKKCARGLERKISNYRENQELRIEEIHEDREFQTILDSYLPMIYTRLRKLQCEVLPLSKEESITTGFEGQSKYHEQLYQFETETQNPFPPYLITCAARAIEQGRLNRLFDDDLAERLAPQTVIQYVDEMDLIDENRPYVAVRTKFFDNFLERVLQENHGLNQFVLLGAGMDTRAFRLEYLEKTAIWELDIPEVIQRKEEALESMRKVRSNHHFIGVDLTQPSWTSFLTERGYNSKLPSVWLLEGILMYLSEDNVRNLFRNIQKITAHGSQLGADLINEKAILGREKLWKSGFDNPEDLLSEYCWNASVIQPGEEGTSFDRYTHKLPPRKVADVERAFFVTACKM